MAACAATFAFGHNANALTLSIGDSHELGYVWSTQSSGNNSTTYVNHLVGMALGSIDIGIGQTYWRSNNAFGSLPTAIAALSGKTTTINIGTAGLYTYLFANYGPAGAEVWYVGNLTGTLSIPASVGLSRLNGWTLFQACPTGVPDGGVTAIMLGVALCVLGISHRFVMRQPR
jgi:hypothetical protein